MIKLLRIAGVLNDRCGGMSRTMHLTGDHLQQDGFDIRYIFRDGFKWQMHHGLSRFALPWEAGLRMRQVQRDWGGCDLVEVHEPLSIGCTLAKRFLPGTKVVGFSYGVERRSYGITADYRRRHGLPAPLKGRVTSFVQGQISLAGLQLCDHVVCSNSEDIAYLRDQGIAADKLTRHFSGVDDSMLTRGRGLPAAGRNQRILYLGTWIDRKGVREIVSAITSVLRSRPMASFTAAGTQVPDEVVIGCFPQDVRDRVCVLRRLESEDELVAQYGSHSIFVLPSFHEGQPLVMMEAAAFGMAIVTTPVCGMLDFIRDDENGIFTPVGDAESCTCRILELLDDPARAERLGRRAQEDVTHFTWRASARNLARSYRRVVGVHD